MGLAAALAEARADRDALQQELESWRAACSFLEQRLAEERADARLSPPPREPPPRPPSRDASTSADTVDAAANAADAPAAYNGDASTRGELARSLALDLKALSAHASPSASPVPPSPGALQTRVTELTAQLAAADAARAELDGELQAARARAAAAQRALQRRPETDGSAAEVAALRELLQMALAMCDDALRHAAAASPAAVASARRALLGCAAAAARCAAR